jgi:hypothetical protein
MVKLIRSTLIILLVIVTFYALNIQASSETVQYPIGGESVVAISGYVITNLRFHLADDPSFISGVDFYLDDSASEVQIHFDTESNPSFSCFNPAGYHWVCELDNINTGEVRQISISASG